MSLLANLTLTYETLANDPIELGIHYGKSILKVLSKTSSNKPLVRSRFSVPAPRLRQVVRSPKIERPATPVARRDYSAYNIKFRSSPAPSRAYRSRELIGAM